MKTIPLTNGRAAIVDDCDYEHLSKFKWRANPDIRGGCFYASRSATLGVEGGPRQRDIKMHREVMGMSAINGFHVDHINHDTLDNRRENLRIVTSALNQMNARPRRDNASGYPGVCWHKKSQKYAVKMRVKGKWISLGYYDDPAEGSKVYEAKRIERLGLIQQLKEEKN